MMAMLGESILVGFPVIMCRLISINKLMIYGEMK